MTKERIKKILQELWRYEKTYKYTEAEIRQALDMAIKALEQTKWIPISERLPEEGEVVLTQAKFKDDIKMVVSSRTDYNYWNGWGTREINIVAWMPLPEPYKVESEDKE